MTFWSEGAPICKIIDLMHEFCETVPVDYDYEKEEESFCSMKRDWLNNAVDIWTNKALGMNEKDESLSVYEKCEMIKEKYKCLRLVCDLFNSFVGTEHGEYYKSLLQKYFLN